mgnify:CR=1 FL=1
MLDLQHENLYQNLFFDSFQYLPGSNYQTFTTPMTKYYSKLDENSTTPVNSSVIPVYKSLSVNFLNEMTQEELYDGLTFEKNVFDGLVFNL